jgi:hypothetical protein
MRLLTVWNSEDDYWSSVVLFLEQVGHVIRGPNLRNSETLLFDWDTAEAGRAFEMTTFGTVVHPINARRDDAAGL